MAFLSKKLVLRKEQYSTIEKECLAIKLRIEAFNYLVDIQTDYCALMWLNRLEDKEAQLNIWSIALQLSMHNAYNFLNN